MRRQSKTPNFLSLLQLIKANLSTSYIQWDILNQETLTYVPGERGRKAEA